METIFQRSIKLYISDGRRVSAFFDKQKVRKERKHVARPSHFRRSTVSYLHHHPVLPIQTSLSPSAASGKRAYRPCFSEIAGPTAENT
jgi:hypothetical protein